MIRYRHTQIGYLNIIVSAIGLLLSASIMIAYGFDWGFLIGMVIFGACLMLFSTLTVVIKKDVLEIKYGPIHFIQKKISLKDIESCCVMENPLRHGKEVFSSNCSFYGFYDSYAVEIKTKTGKKYYICTNVSNKLEKAVQRAIEK